MPNITALPTLEGYGLNGNTPVWAVGGSSGSNLYARAWNSEGGRGTIVYQFKLDGISGRPLLPAGSVITNCRIRFQTLNSTGTWDYRFQRIALYDNATAPTAITVNGTSPNRPMDHRDAARFVDPAVSVRFYADSAGAVENDPRGSGMLISTDIYTTDIKEQLQYLVSSPYWNPTTSVINVIWYGELNPAVISLSIVRRATSYIHVDYTAPPTPTGTMTAAASAPSLLVPSGQRFFAGDLLGAGYGNIYTIANDAPFDGIINTGITGGLGYDSSTMIYDDLSVNYDGETPHSTDSIFIVGISRMGSRARLGGIANDYNIFPIGIPSTSTVPNVIGSSTVQGIVSSSTIGTGIRIDRTLNVGGISTDPDTVGSVRVTRQFTVTGYSTADDVIGSVRIDRTLRVTGVNSTNSFGTIRSDFSIRVYAIVENEDLIGSLTLRRVGYVDVVGIDEGLDTLGEITATYILNVFGIHSTSFVGTVRVNRSGYVAGIIDPDVIGTIGIDRTLPVTGIPNTDTIGVPNVARWLRPVPLQDSDQIGTITISKTNTINVLGVQSINRIGSAQMDPTYGFFANVFGDGDDDTIGVPRIDLTLPVTGLVDTDTIGSVTVQGQGYLTVTGISSTSTVPLPTIANVNSISVTGIGSASTIGVPAVARANSINAVIVSDSDVIGVVRLAHVISPAGIVSTNTIGTVTQAQFVNATGIVEADQFGTPRFGNVNNVTGIVDPDIIPPITIQRHISRSVVGIQSTSVVGSALVGPGFFVEIIPPDNTIGTISIDRGISVIGVSEPDEFGLIYIPVLYGDRFFIFFHLGF